MGFRCEKNRMHGKRGRTTKETQMQFRFGDGPVDPGHHHTSLLEVSDRLPQPAYRTRNKIHPRSLAYFIFHAASTPGIRDGEHQWFQTLPAKPLKRQIEV